jgi:hypothetical protein
MEDYGFLLLKLLLKNGKRKAIEEISERLCWTSVDAITINIKKLLPSKSLTGSIFIDMFRLSLTFWKLHIDDFICQKNGAEVVFAARWRLVALLTSPVDNATYRFPLGT